MYLQNRLCFELAKMMTKFYDLLCTTQKFIAFMFFTNVCVIWCFTLLFKKDKKQYSFFGAQYFCSYCWEKSIEEGDILIAWIFTHRMSQKSCLVWRIHSWISYHETVSQWPKIYFFDRNSSWTYWKISIPSISPKMMKKVLMKFFKLFRSTILTWKKTV